MVQVEDRDDSRYLLVNHEMESCFSLKRKREVLFPYMRQFSYAFSVNADIHSCLLIGGGACAYPSFYLRHYPQNTIDVIEISSTVLEMAEIYFGLGQIKENPRMHIYNMDAMVFLATHDLKYDLIINDAFIGREESLRNSSHAQSIYSHLNKNGVYLINLVSAIRGPFAKNLKQTKNALKICFKDSAYLPCSDMYSPLEKQNLVLAASDHPLP